MTATRDAFATIAATAKADACCIVTPGDGYSEEQLCEMLADASRQFDEIKRMAIRASNQCREGERQ